MSGRIVVLGSANVDMIMKMSHLPRRGETVTDARFMRTLGGKGANQAIAAARAGGSVSFVGCVGNDPGGAEIAGSLQTAGIDTEFLFTAEGVPSGAALVMIGQEGDNYLSVAPGSNYHLAPEHVDRASALIERSVLLVVQCEVLPETLRHAIRRAADQGRGVLLNLAPARPVDRESLCRVTYLVVNETEAEFLCGFAVDSLPKAAEAATAIQAIGPKVVIVTLGVQGALVADGQRRFHVPAFPVEAVDATAAGDAFCGSLAAALAEGKSLDEGVQFASAAAAITVTRLGAQPSIPLRSEIERFLAERAVPDKRLSGKSYPSPPTTSWCPERVALRSEPGEGLEQQESVALQSPSPPAPLPQGERGEYGACHVAKSGADPAPAAKLPLAEREAIVQRFGQRVAAALLASPPTKELVRSALRREGAPRCIIRVQRLSLDVILRYGDDLADVFCAYPDDILSPHPYDFFVGYQKPGARNPIHAIQVMTESATWTDEWGTQWGHAAGGVGATPTGHPLAEWSQLDDYLAGAFPDPRAPGRLDPAAAAIRQHGASRYCMGVNVLTIFERLHNLRGMQEVLVDLLAHPCEVQRLLERLTDYHVELIRYWGEIGVDAMFLGDDWGSQRSMIVSPAMWRRLFRPYYARLFDETHRAGMDVIYHSCGNVMDIIPDLIDIGADVLDPIQPVAMDAREIANRFGGKIAFYGGISTQELPRWTPRQVKDEVRRLIDTLGKPFGNAYMIGPANVITPEVPLANIVALCEACREQ